MIAATIAQELLPFLTFLLTAMFAVESARAQSTEDLRQKVLDAWQRRQNSVESATFRIRSTLVLTENQLLRREPRLQTLHGKEPNPKEIPQGDKILIELYEVAFDGDKLRFFMTFDKSTHEIAKSVNRNMTLLHVTNGADYRCLESFPDHGVNSGVIQNADQFPAFKSAEVEPIIQAFRAFSQQRHQLINDLEIVDGEHEIGGRSVVVMQQHSGGAIPVGYSIGRTHRVNMSFCEICRWLAIAELALRPTLNMNKTILVIGCP